MDNKIIMDGITFDNVLLLPGYTDFKRQDVSLETTIHPTITLKLPVISSPMDTVTEENMAIAIATAGGLGIIHRNLSIANQAQMVANVKAKNLLVGAAVGAGSDFENRVHELVTAHCDVIVVDSGHGYSKFVIDAVKIIKRKYAKQVVMAGNIATADGARMLTAAGVDSIRVGMGPGSICTTRIITGMGVPQLTAISEAIKGIKGRHISIIADGGIKQIGDMAKALGFGAHAVMLGSQVAGFDESPGEKVEMNGKTYKKYRGMGSVTSMQKGSAERYGQSAGEEKRKLIAEGVEGLVPYKGAVSDYLEQVAGSLRSSFYYVGARSMSEFHEKAKFIRITAAGMRESHPHSILISDAGGNYTLE